MGESKVVRRRANLLGVAKYISTRKGNVYDLQREQAQVVSISEYDRRAKSEAYSGQVKSGIIIFK